MAGPPELDEFAIERFEHGYGWIEIYLKNNKFVAGDDLTIADFSVMTTVTTMEVSIRCVLKKSNTWH